MTVIARLPLHRRLSANAAQRDISKALAQVGRRDKGAGRISLAQADDAGVRRRASRRQRRCRKAAAAVMPPRIALAVSSKSWLRQRDIRR